MNPTNPIFAALIICIALATCKALKKRVGEPEALGKFESLDGLRGLLALCVFISHSSTWYFYARTEQWVVPPSNLYTHFGKSSVVLFFMITGLLFYSKIIDKNNNDLDWGKIFLSRITRLVPLYLLMTTLVFCLAIFLSKGQLRVSSTELLKSIFHWATFTMLGAPDINDIKNTSVMVAGITWALTYEWLFYLLLPALALARGSRPPWQYLLLSMLAILYLIVRPTFLFGWLAFAGGMVAAHLVRWNKFCHFSKSKIASILIISILSFNVWSSPGAYSEFPIALIAIAFSFIAGGNSLMGLLTSSSMRFLGQISYGIYLLHGLALYTVLSVIIEKTTLQAFNPIEFWLVILVMTPVLIVVCTATFTSIERPAMRATSALLQWLRSCIVLQVKKTPG